MKKRPNILFALADDASHFGIDGHRFVRTPAIDAVAGRGIHFLNAFTSNPKCAPSRASILTGRYPWQLEEACNHYCYFPAGYELLPDLLEQTGYHIGYTGKGWAPGNYEQAGLKRNPAGIAYNECTLTPPEGSCISRCDYAENFRRFMEAKPSDQPFYFWYGCMEPHRHYSFGEGLRGGKSLREIDTVPDVWPDCDETRIDMLDYAYEIEWFDSHLGKMLSLLESMGELDNTLVVVTSDNGCPFPRIKGQMYEQDFHLPMVAMWNQKLNVQQPRKESGFVSFIDIAPTFLDAAQVPVPQSMTGHSFLAAFQPDEGAYQKIAPDIVLFGREKHDLGRENDLGYPVRCVRTKQYLYIHNFEPDRWPAGNPETGYTNCDSSPTKRIVLDMHEKGEDYYYRLAFAKRPREELYDIIRDPECLCNLATKEHDLCEQLRVLLFEQLRKTGDPRLDDPAYFDRMKLYSEQNAEYSWKAYQEGRWKKQPF